MRERDLILMNNDYRRKNIQDIFISRECVEKFQT